MAKNSNLHQAQNEKNDEFYTMMDTVENELKHYKDQFRGKIVLCNCDDPYESNFFKYFAINFNYLGLKKLICTCYNGSPMAYTQLSIFDFDETTPKEKKIAYKVEISSITDMNGDGIVDLYDVEELLKKPGIVQQLNGNGDFRSAECVELLKKSDIVVTNPPFSLFREYIAQLINYNKNFVILANMNCLTYRDFFPLIKNNKIWVGYGFNKTMEFIMPDDYIMKGKAYIDENGKKHGFVPAICWFTNLDVKKHHEVMTLYKKYNQNEYPNYENYDAIEVSKVNEIPIDYDGIMGVPITFIDKYNPNQFEIIGMAHGDAGVELGLKPYPRELKKINPGLRDGDLYYLKDGYPILPYRRILIKKKG